ncbi:MAG: glycosyl transferase family 2 [Gallionellales bacterium RIFCSPLOWO2_12_FULL_59_22]|nr:MAG: glycosyl transferase family 2 [Gallionellales bacterium RIFCSPLOWO2_12_FULL_59_22]
MMRIALVVTTYNRPDALAAVLEGCLAQTDANFEVIVADDGSTRETAALVAGYAARAPFAIRHVWQEDQGFRAAAIRNRALATTQADYIIFIDGDSVPPPDFVASHRRLAEHGWFLSGNRLMLTQALSEQVLRDQLPVHLWQTRDWLQARRRGQIERLLPLLRLPIPGWLRKQLPRRWQGAKTCNLSAWREDLLRVNGLDESYAGWGLEDSDLVIRLLRAGIYNKSARFAAPVFHLWHRENDRSCLAENQQRLQEVLQATHIRAAKGVDQYL